MGYSFGGVRPATQSRLSLSFAPPGLANLTCLPMAYAMGCILSPLRGLEQVIPSLYQRQLM